jgi:hypothetical protein
MPSMTTRVGNVDSESGSALLKPRRSTVGHVLAIALNALVDDLATTHDLFDGYAEHLCEHGRLSKSDRLFFCLCHDRGYERRTRMRPLLFHV